MPRSEIDYVSDIIIFKGITAGQKSWLAARIFSKEFPPFNLLFSAGQPGEIVYFINTGTVRIYRDAENGTQITIALLGNGEILGEMGMLDKLGRSECAITQEPCKLSWMKREDFIECLETMPIVASNLISVLSKRIQLAYNQISALASLSVGSRVSRVLLAFLENYGNPTNNTIPLRLTQHDIASLVVASRERVNQAMVHFKKQNLIKVDEGYFITITNKEGLEYYSRNDITAMENVEK